MFKISAVFPVYNALDVVQVSLSAIARQDVPSHLDYELVVVDDGSDEPVRDWLARQTYPHLRLVRHHRNRGRSAARNTAFRNTTGDAIVFVDADVIVGPDFIARHAAALGIEDGVNPADLPGRVSIGRLVDTYDLTNPLTEPPSVRDFSLAHFPSANVAIARKFLERIQETDQGPFDEERFVRYGWEDLELGYRLSKLKLKRVRNSNAIGFHYCPPFTLDQMQIMLTKEVDRARMANVFLEKHPNWEVRLMVQKTFIQRIPWEIVSLGGLLNERSLRPLLRWLIGRGKERLAASIARLLILNPRHVRSL